MSLIENYINRLNNNDSSLTKLKIKNQCLGLETFINLTNAIGKNNKLIELDLINVQSHDDKYIYLTLSNEYLQYLGEALKINKTLKNLSLSSRIDDEGAEYILESMKTNNTLTELVLYGNLLTRTGAKYLGETLEKNTTLESLDVGRNFIDDIKLKYISQALAKNKTLKKLNLVNNKIGDEGSQYLRECIKKNKTLTELDLSYNLLSSNESSIILKLFKRRKEIPIRRREIINLFYSFSKSDIFIPLELQIIIWNYFSF